MEDGMTEGFPFGLICFDIVVGRIASALLSSRSLV